jgi:hypothetical protein
MDHQNATMSGLTVEFQGRGARWDSEELYSHGCPMSPAKGVRRGGSSPLLRTLAYLRELCRRGSAENSTHTAE